MTKDEAMKLALEALEHLQPTALTSFYTIGDRNKAITALREALAQAEQEPVAWIEHEWSGTGLKRLHFERREPMLRDEVVNPVWTPLYTSLQAQRKTLTPEWIWMWLRNWCGSHPSLRQETYNSLYKMVSDARAIEAAHNIK